MFEMFILVNYILKLYFKVKLLFYYGHIIKLFLVLISKIILLRYLLLNEILFKEIMVY